MEKFKRADLIAGWAAFLVASVSYLLTIEPTASYWDCGEFICTAFRQEVGHPPGAPFFMILGRFFSLFAGGDVTKVAACINSMSALASGFTVLFLYWSISHIAKKIIVGDNNEVSVFQSIEIIGSALVGSLAFAYTDTFWFSAVEGEVYAMSSLFTAVVFWCILKWEAVADEKYSNRWLILICYLMGLSIGVHLLNLLVIPAIVLVYYFKKYKVTTKGVIYSLLISFVILGGILYGIIPGVVWVASRFELVFTNGFGLPYNTGTYIYALLGIGGLAYGLWYSFKKKKVVLNTALLGVAVIIIGYSCFAMIVIRSLANPPMDENNPDNVFALQSYLNREQYGDRPLIKGEYFNSKQTGYDLGSPTYIKRNGRYEIVDYKSKPVYDKESTTIFPRMYSPDPSHIKSYQYWAGITNTESKPSFGENLTFFFRYQVGYMYIRYFLWNFVGRQNDIQGVDENLMNGNWISGVSFIDNARLGDQDTLPDYLKNNKGNNRYFFLPLILGILGMIFMFRENIVGKQYFWIVMLMFLITGVAIVVYLNQTPYQPRERDYAYAGSFYAFAFYIGFGVAYLCKLSEKLLKKQNTAVAAVVLALGFICGPIILAAENWDDHDRSGRYTARDFAKNYLESCAPNAILFTNGDNDTFPLWYAQEVEGIRTDVRVVNLAYSNTDWYINQLRRKAYLSDPLPISIDKDKLVEGSRDISYIQEVPQLFLQEKYNDNINKYQNTLNILHDALVSVLQNSRFKEVLPKDYEAIVVNNQLKGDILQIARIINSLSQQYAKFSINQESITRLKNLSDELCKQVGAEAAPVASIVDFIASDDEYTKMTVQNGEKFDFSPTYNFSLKVDKAKVLASGIVSEKDSAKIVDKIVWKHPHHYIRKNELMVLDILAHNNWERPVYFAITVGSEAFQNLDAYFRLDGLAYKIVPIKTEPKNGDRGFVDSDVLYDKYMNVFQWGGISNPKVYLDENNNRMLMNIKSGFMRLAETLLLENKHEKAVEVLDKCYKELPLDVIPVSYYDIFLGTSYYEAGAVDKAHTVWDALKLRTHQELMYFMNLDSYQQNIVRDDYMRAVAVTHNLVNAIRECKDMEYDQKFTEEFLADLRQIPMLSTITPAMVETSEFMSTYQRMSDFEKQLVQVYLYLLGVL